MVAAHAHMDEIEALRAALPDTTPMWLNAFDPRPADYYTPEQVQRLSRIDPYVGYNLTPPPSFGAPCLTGESVLWVDGDGTVRRCNFVDTPLGNLYDGSFAAQLRARSCPNTRCDCFIGYVHRPDLPFQADYAGGMLEPVPATA